MAVVIDGTNGINTPDLESAGPVTGTTATFSGNVLLGSSVLATPVGSAPSYTCRAWVNFNGTGTVAIRASGNVSSITDNGTGQYTVNFTTAMPDANCAPVAAGMRYAGSVSYAGGVYANMSSTSAIRVFTGYEDTLSGQIPADLEFVQIAIFR